MPRKPEPLEPWMLDAIELIVRRDLTLRMAAQQLGQDLTPQQCDNLMGRIRFQRELEEARLKYYADLFPRICQHFYVSDKWPTS